MSYKTRKKRLSYQRKWVKKNKHKVQLYMKKYREENKEKISKMKKDYSFKHRDENKEEKKEYQSTYYQLNKDKVLLRCKKYRDNNKEKRSQNGKTGYLKKVYGLTNQGLDKMINECDGKCHICGIKMTSSKKMTSDHLCIDHDHKTNIIRGLLCRSCNVLLGFAKDDISILKSAIKYLQKFNKKYDKNK